MGIVTPIILVSVIGVVSGIGLTLAAKFMAVPVDETAVKIRECLPGANCGGCGYAGCDDYASALAADHSLSPSLCAPGGAAAAAGIAAVLGVEAGSAVPKVARVRCSGLKDKTKESMEYQGFSTCAAAKLFFGGPGSCKNGCIGFGDCVSACAYDAIRVCNGVAQVDRDLCVACGMCAKACPNALIEIVPKSSRVFVGCSSTDPGKKTREVCEVGCIACKLCEKACKFDAVKVENNHAVIDAEKCKNCGLCAKACPRHIIHVIPKPGAKPAVPKPEVKPAEKQVEAPVKEEAPEKTEAVEKTEAPAKAPAETPAEKPEDKEAEKK